MKSSFRPIGRISMTVKVVSAFLLGVVLMAQSAFAQASAVQQSKPSVRNDVVPEVVPIDKEPAHRLVFENEYVRVFSVEVAPHSETKYHQHDRDYVWVSLGDSDVESVRVGATAVSVKPKDGETQFTKGGFAHKAVNKSDKPFRNVTVEFKKKAKSAKYPQEVTNFAADSLSPSDPWGGGRYLTIVQTEHYLADKLEAYGPISKLLDGGSLAIFVNDATLVKGKSEQSVRRGDVIWLRKDTWFKHDSREAVVILLKFGKSRQ